MNTPVYFKRGTKAGCPKCHKVISISHSQKHVAKRYGLCMIKCKYCGATLMLERLWRLS